MRVNLISKEKKGYYFNWYNYLFPLFIILVFLIFAFNFYFTVNKLDELQKEISLIDNKLKVFLPKQREYLELKEKLENIKLLDRRESTNNKNWSIVIEELGFVTPESVMLTNLQINDFNINIKGKAKENIYLIQFVKNLKESPYFINVKLDNMVRYDDINFTVKARLTGSED